MTMGHGRQSGEEARHSAQMRGLAATGPQETRQDLGCVREQPPDPDGLPEVIQQHWIVAQRERPDDQIVRQGNQACQVTGGGVRVGNPWQLPSRSGAAPRARALLRRVPVRRRGPVRRPNGRRRGRRVDGASSGSGRARRPSAGRRSRAAGRPRRRPPPDEAGDGENAAQYLSVPAAENLVDQGDPESTVGADGADLTGRPRVPGSKRSRIRDRTRAIGSAASLGYHVRRSGPVPWCSLSSLKVSAPSAMKAVSAIFRISQASQPMPTCPWHTSITVK
jgi:hypothetical protein